MHDYIEDFDAGHVTQIDIGMDAADFAMGVYVTSTSGEHRHTEGDLTGETISGWRNGATVVDASFSTADFDFQMQSVNWFILSDYEIRHTPGRTLFNVRTSTNQDYTRYYQTTGSTSALSMTSTTNPGSNTSGSANSLAYPVFPFMCPIPSAGSTIFLEFIIAPLCVMEWTMFLPACRLFWTRFSVLIRTCNHE